MFTKMIRGDAVRLDYSYLHRAHTPDASLDLILHFTIIGINTTNELVPYVGAWRGVQGRSEVGVRIIIGMGWASGACGG